MEKLRCGLLGRKLGHSYSPELHAMMGDYGYALFEVEPDRLSDFVAAREFHGINVTIPYKTVLLDLCDHLTDAAQAIGSVNTVVKLADGSLLGDNTDAAGFEAMVWHSRVPVTGRKCLVLGSGGASLSVRYVLQRLGAGEIITVSRIGRDNYENLDRHADAEVIVNATPVGMYPNTGAAAVDLRQFPLCKGVLDLVYNPARTMLIQQAEALGIPCLGGLYMLVEQARCASRRFQGEGVPIIRTQAAYQEIRSRKENRVLIGMPGCGKNTVGLALAAQLSRPFVDSDQELEKALGMSCERYILEQGEEAFRDRETEILEQLGKESGLVIATGGGCVTRPENYPLLHQNVRMIFLERELSKLPLAGRPLSQRGSLEDLYTVRLPLYRSFADLIVPNRGEPEAVAHAVEEAYEHFGD